MNCRLCSVDHLSIEDCDGSIPCPECGSPDTQAHIDPSTRWGVVWETHCPNCGLDGRHDGDQYPLVH